jgi:radical SAM superfamily enzyme YgiQ (UPF0313 family)
MRVLLINPFYPISETPSPPLGLAYLASALEAAGASVRVLDLVVTPYSEAALARTLEEFKPGLVGATAVTMTVDHAMAVIGAVKRLAPQVLTVMGGPHVTFSAREALDACPALDVVVLGEGERTVVELCRRLEDGGGLAGVPGIAFRAAGETHLTPARDFIPDLDALPPPARHLLPLGRYRALGMPISMTTSRGCPFHCIFCVGRRMVGAKVRYRSPVMVVDEMQALGTLGFHQINIADDLFTADCGHCRAVCDEIIRRGLALRWTSFARVDTVTEDLLGRMKAAGCTAVSFGIESANPGILRTIRKGITLEQVRRAVAMCRRAGVTPFASFILGLPGETPATIRETMEFGKALQQEGLLYGFHVLAPFPGTEVRERSAALGIHILTNDWSRYHANRAVTETAAVSQAELDRIVIDWEQDFNRYLGDIKLRMQAGDATPEESFQLVNLERIVLIYELMMKSIIETEGILRDDPQAAPGEDPIEALARRIQGRMPCDAALLLDSLRTAAERGDLFCERQADGERWRWRDYLPLGSAACGAERR